MKDYNITLAGGIKATVRADSVQDAINSDFMGLTEEQKASIVKVEQKGNRVKKA